MTGLVPMSRITMQTLRTLRLGANVVGCSTGNLDGSAPFEILSTYCADRTAAAPKLLKRFVQIVRLSSDNWNALIAKSSRLPPPRQHNTRAYCGITWLGSLTSVTDLRGRRLSGLRDVVRLLVILRHTPDQSLRNPHGPSRGIALF